MYKTKKMVSDNLKKNNENH